MNVALTDVNGKTHKFESQFESIFELTNSINNGSPFFVFLKGKGENSVEYAIAKEHIVEMYEYLPSTKTRREGRRLVF